MNASSRALAAAAACSPHPRTAQRALLDRGYHGIIIGDYPAACFPRAGAEPGLAALPPLREALRRVALASWRETVRGAEMP